VNNRVDATPTVTLEDAPGQPISARLRRREFRLGDGGDGQAAHD
jgi:hypothetical protein